MAMAMAEGRRRSGRNAGSLKEMKSGPSDFALNFTCPASLHRPMGAMWPFVFCTGTEEVLTGRLKLWNRSVSD
jgi:hypothetical protein